MDGWWHNILERQGHNLELGKSKAQKAIYIGKEKANEQVEALRFRQEAFLIGYSAVQRYGKVSAIYNGELVERIYKLL